MVTPTELNLHINRRRLLVNSMVATTAVRYPSCRPHCPQALRRRLVMPRSPSCSSMQNDALADSEQHAPQNSCDDVRRSKFNLEKRMANRVTQIVECIVVLTGLLLFGSALQ